MALTSGTKLGPYEIQSPLGAGGMGEVYRTRDTRLDREVAIKVLPVGFARDPERLRRFQQEAQAAAALNHPNILAVHDFGEHEGSPYMVTEFLEGETLRERLRPGTLPVPKATEYAEQVARGLAAAHRDLKPENIFVTRDGRVKILDFGLAKLTRPEGTVPSDAATPASQTEPGMVMGTVGYMSPEQVKGQNADHRSDLFSFGAILYEMLSGKRAFSGETSGATLRAILLQDRARGFNPGPAAAGPFSPRHSLTHRAETEKIGAVVGVLSLHLLRRHVADRTHHHAGLGLRGQGRGVGRNRALGAGELGQTEVQNLHPTVARDKNILRLQIAVDDSLLMRRRQTTRHVLGVFGGFAQRQRPGTQPLAQCLT